MDSVFITTRKQRIIRELRDYMLIALGMLMYAIGPVCRFSTPIWE